MKFTKQRFRHDPDNGVYGDCHRTAIACVLDMEPEDVPHFAEHFDDADKFNAAAEAFLRSKGLTSVAIAFTGSLDDVLATVARLNGDDLIYLLGGESRTGVNHTVVCRGDSIIHDPSLNDAGIVGPCDDGFYWLTFFCSLAVSRAADKREAA